MKHAFCSPSASNIWLNCAASPKNSQGVENKVGIAAATGTLIHQMAEMKQKGNMENTNLTEFWLGKEENVEDFQIIVDNEMIDCAEVYIDYVNKRHQELGGSLLIEEQFTLNEISDACWGTADAVILGKDRIAVIDLKTGKWNVERNKNTQLMIYALGVLSRYGDENTLLELTIVQPRSAKKGSPIKTWETSAEYLVDWAYRTLKPACEATLSETPEEILGDHCKFCNGKVNCVAYKNKMEVPDGN